MHEIRVGHKPFDVDKYVYKIVFSAPIIYLCMTLPYINKNNVFPARNMSQKCLKFQLLRAVVTLLTINALKTTHIQTIQQPAYIHTLKLYYIHLLYI